MRLPLQLPLGTGTALAALALAACSTPGENETGSEYMPDMAHSIAYEANVYFDYYYNQWDSASVKSRYELAQPGLPVNGTVPRGYAGYVLNDRSASASAMSDGQLRHIRELYGINSLQAIATPMNGSAPYYYYDTEADRVRAIEDLQTNPFPITADGLKRGQELYETFCGICHGDDGGGNGWIYENGAYPVAPRNFLEQTWVDTSAGVYYHAVMYGKNAMGAYKDKISYEERYQVIHYIRALQAKWAKKQYDQDGNDLIPNEAIAGANATQYVRLLESFSREPTDYESSESTNSDVVPGGESGGAVPGAVPNSQDTTGAVGTSPRIGKAGQPTTKKVGR